MKKTVEVEISGINFSLNTDAYDLLAHYLEEMEVVFSSLPEKTEIIEDIESRIAEELLKLTKKTKVVNAAQILTLLEKIGSPDEINDVLGSFDYDQKTEVKGRLYRDPDNRIIGGVASGIAAYFGIDPVIVRLLFIVVTLAGGAGILAYLVLYLIIPQAKTPLQKMEMHGGGNALRKIDKSLRDLARRFKIPEMTRKFEEKINRGLKKSKPKAKKEAPLKKTVKQPVKKKSN